MAAVNDLEGCTYMNQSLPFGGYKQSGYDRFAGPEGLRGLCHVRSFCEDRLPWLRNAIPAPLQYPATGSGPRFAMGLVSMFYGTSVAEQGRGLAGVIGASLFGAAAKAKPADGDDHADGAGRKRQQAAVNSQEEASNKTPHKRSTRSSSSSEKTPVPAAEERSAGGQQQASVTASARKRSNK